MSFRDSLLYGGTPAEQLGLESLCKLQLESSFWPYPEFVLSLKIPQTFLIFQEERSDWIGLALGRVISGTAELFFIFVRPDMRRKGLARKLLSDFETHAFQHFLAESIFLEVRPSNRSAIELYESMGFVRSGRRPRYYQDGEDAWLYQKARE